MVHALEKTLEMLKPGGEIIVLHDLTVPPLVEVKIGGQIQKVGRLCDHSGFEMVQKADDAVTKVMENNNLAMSDALIFDYEVHMASLDDFNEWLDRQWETSYLPDEALKQVTKVMTAAKDDGQIVVQRSARLMRLCSL